MKFKQVNKLLNKYAVCPKCGCDTLGNGDGTLVVEDTTFERTCKCGFSVKVNEEEEEC